MFILCDEVLDFVIVNYRAGDLKFNLGLPEGLQRL